MDQKVQWTCLEKGRIFRDLMLSGRALAGVVIASLSTSAEGSSATTSKWINQVRSAISPPRKWNTAHKREWSRKP
eukprot:4807949-Amphidinium_carterae.2